MRRAALLLGLLAVVLAANLGGRPAPAPRPPAPPPNDRPEPEPGPPIGPAPFTVPSPDPLTLGELPDPADPVPVLAPSRRVELPRSVGPFTHGPLAVSGDGSRVAFPFGWRGVAVWDVAAGVPVRRLDAAGYPFALSPDGRTLYAGSYDGWERDPLRVWDVETGDLLRERPGCRWAVSADGRTLATADIHLGTIDRMGVNEPDIPHRSTLTVWDTATWQPRRSFTYTGYVPDSLAVSADGSKVASTRQAAVTVFDAATGRPVAAHQLATTSAPHFRATVLAFAPDGRAVAVGGDGLREPPAVHLFDPAAGTARTLIDRPGVGVFGQPAVVGFGFTPDGRSAVVGFGDAIVPVDVATGTLPPVRPLGPGAEAWRADPRYDFARRGLQPSHLEGVWAFALSGDRKTAVLAGNPSGVGPRLWAVDVATRAVRYPPAGPDPAPPAGPVPDNLLGPACPEWLELPKGSRWKQLGWESRSWQLRAAGQDGLEREAITGDTLGYALTPDGATLITRTRGDPWLRVRDVATGAVRGQIPDPDHRRNRNVRPMAVSPGGRSLAVLGPDGAVRLWELATLRPRVRLDPGADEVYRFAFSPDGRSVTAHAPFGRTALVWDLPAKP